MTDKKKDDGYVPDWHVDTNEEALKNDGKDYQTEARAKTDHGRSGSTEPSAVYADDKSKRRERGD
jgi:hypothetical protein